MSTDIRLHQLKFTFYSCSMGTCHVIALQLLCNTSGKADSLNANTSLIAGFYSYACLKDLIMAGKIKVL